MKELKTIPANCECGGEIIQKVETGYVSARELGRPAGAKGSDTWTAWHECAKCGKVQAPRRKPEPCHICGSEKHLTQYDMCQMCELVTGMYEWVPGIDNSVNLCSNPNCFRAMERKIKKIMRNACFE